MNLQYYKEKPTKSYIEDIIKVSEKILSYTKEISYEQFIIDEMLKDALVRNMEIIDEASTQLRHKIDDKHVGDPLVKLITSRNKLIHDYDQIDFDIVWETVIHDIPQLIEICERIMKKDTI